MTDIKLLHQKAMELAEQAEVAKLRVQRLSKFSSFCVRHLNRNPKPPLWSWMELMLSRSVLHRSAAALAIDCGELQAAERLITTALSGNPPAEIAAELKDLFIQINLPQYCERRGLTFHAGFLNHPKIA
jgi:hypothetical protein